MQQKSFLIVTASIGSGHIKAAESVSNEIKIKYPDARIHIIDFMSADTARFNALLKAIYLQMLDFVPNLYEFLYKFTSGRNGHRDGFSVQSLLSLIMKRTMASLVRQYHPDVVICTHPFPAGAASFLKRSSRQRFLFAAVMTDYSVHEMWVYPNVDLYFVACEAMKRDLVEEGIPGQRIFVTGIPVYRGFAQLAGEKEKIFTTLGLQVDLPVVLLMGGGLGLGGMDITLQQMEAVETPLQILAVAGQNQLLLEKLKRLAVQSRHVVRVWGYTDQVHEFMTIASFLITKPGALTISEAFAAELPLLLHEPIPGPETQNAIYASSRGAAVWIQSEADLVPAVQKVLQSPDILREMQQQERLCKQPDAAGKIIDCIMRCLLGSDWSKKLPESAE